jgi:hypothetical protein
MLWRGIAQELHTAVSLLEACKSVYTVSDTPCEWLTVTATIAWCMSKLQQYDSSSSSSSSANKHTLKAIELYHQVLLSVKLAFISYHNVAHYVLQQHKTESLLPSLLIVTVRLWVSVRLGVVLCEHDVCTRSYLYVVM